jgi:hypothetical protein
LSEISHLITSAGSDSGVTYAAFDDPTDEEMLIVTDRMDFGFRGQKTIELVEVGWEGSESLYAAIDFRMSGSDSWERTGWVEVNDQDVAAIRIAGVEFRLCLKHEDYSQVTSISYIKSRFKMTDLRSIRGVYAPPPRGQSYASTSDS